MGKVSRWLSSLLTFENQQPSNHQQQQQQRTPVKEKSRWSFVKSSTKHKRNISRNGVVFEAEEVAVIDPDKHAIAVAVAAAKAAAEVLKLSGSKRWCDSSSYYGYGRGGGGGARQRWAAAVVIQSAFRGYLARRALKALKALVRLQALVRGHIARKQTAEHVRQLQALLRVQARARAGRAFRSESSQSSSRSSHHHPPDPQTPEKSEEIRSSSPRRNQPSSFKRDSSKSESKGIIGQVRSIRGTNQANNRGINDRVWDPLNDQPIDKILEVDPGKPCTTSRQKNLFHGSHHTWGLCNQNILTQAAPVSNPYEALPLTPKNIACELEDASFCTAENSPQLFPASSDYTNYMCYTESSKAKLRSMSAPKQRLQYERSSSTKRQSYHAVNDSKSGSEKSTSYSSFTSKAYHGSGRLDKHGMPVMRGDSYSYASSYGRI